MKEPRLTPWRRFMCWLYDHDHVDYYRSVKRMYEDDDGAYIREFWKLYRSCDDCSVTRLIRSEDDHLPKQRTD